MSSFFNIKKLILKISYLRREASSWNKSSCLAPTLGVTKVIIVTDMICHTLLCYLSRTWMFNTTTSEAGLLNKSSCLAPTLGVTKFIIVTDMIGSHFAVLLKSDLDVQQNYLRCRFVELMLSSSYRCDQIYKSEIYNFCHTLLCYLSPT